MPDRAFWTGRRVFLTGHTGFKGSWLALWLERLGARVTGYALPPPTQPSLYEQAGVARTLRSIEADIRDLRRLDQAVAEAEPEVVLHLAAQSVVRHGYQDPVETYSANVMGTVHVLEAIRRLNRPCVVVVVTTDKCYENREWVWGYRETDRLGGRDPYSNSKACAELVADAYRQSYFAADAGAGVALATVRAGNVIGGGDWTRDQLIPDLMRAFMDGRPCPIRNPAAVRPWQFVLEPLRGYLTVAEKLAADPVRFQGGWNFGPASEDAMPVAWIADRLCEAWGGGAAWQSDGRAHPHEARWLMLDISKARAELGWRPLLALGESLAWITDWYRAFERGNDVARLTRQQIERYEERLAADADPAPAGRVG